MSADRKLIEAQVVFGMFPEAALITDRQDAVLQDAVAGRVHRINHAAAVKMPRSNPAREAMVTLGQEIRAGHSHLSIWQVAVRRILDSYDNDGDLVNGVKVGAISDQGRLQTSTCKADLGGISITFDFDSGKSRNVSASTAYNYLME